MELHVSSLGLLIFALAVGAAHAQQGEITAGAVHKQSGEPFNGILVAVDAPKYYGRHPTDSNGVVRLTDVPVGTWHVEFHCPNANFVGREIETRLATVEPGEVTSVKVEVPGNYCYEPPYSELQSEFRGYVAFGFEYRSFIPCEADSLNLSRNTFSGSNSIWASNVQSESLELEPDTLYYIEFKGVLKGPGRFGHLGVADYEVVIDDTHEVYKVGNQDCSRDPRSEV